MTVRRTREQFERDFNCPKCHGRGAVAAEVSLGRSMARLLPLPPNRYLAVSCGLCGYTELYLLAILERAREPEESPVAAPVNLADKS